MPANWALPRPIPWPDEMQESTALSLISVAFQNTLVMSILITGKAIWPVLIRTIWDCLVLAKTVSGTMLKVELYGQLRPVLVVSVDIVRVLFAWQINGAHSLTSEHQPSEVQPYPTRQDQGFRFSSGGCLEAKRDQDWNENWIVCIIYERRRKRLKKLTSTSPLFPFTLCLWHFCAISTVNKPGIQSPFSICLESAGEAAATGWMSCRD